MDYSIGTDHYYLPERKIDHEYSLRECDSNAQLLEQKTGNKERRAAEVETSSDMVFHTARSLNSIPAKTKQLEQPTSPRTLVCCILGRGPIIFKFGTVIEGFPFLAAVIASTSGAQPLSLDINSGCLVRMHFRTVDKPAYTEAEMTQVNPLS